MASFGDHIKAFTGVETVDSLTSNWLTESAKDVINILPPQILYIVSTDINFSSGSGTTVPQSRILEVVRWGGDPRIENECREIDSALRGKATPTSGYIEEATEDSPVFWRRKNKVRVLPPPTENDFAKITYVTYPSIVHSQTSIPGFPDEIEHLVVLKASVKAKLSQIADANVDDDIEVATSHTNHMTVINQEYAAALQGFMTGFGHNSKEQGFTSQ